jgi:hypothetical protein
MTKMWGSGVLVYTLGAGGGLRSPRVTPGGVIY